MGRTSQEWWDGVRADEARFNAWLVRQRHAEARAARGIADLAERYAPDATTRAVMITIADQEQQHAAAIDGLLRPRGITAPGSIPESRYWREALPDVVSFETGAAVVAHAEDLSLERIHVIVNDSSGPDDVRRAFERILVDERFHAAAFREMAGPEAMRLTLPSHLEGRRALGLPA